MYQIYDRRFEVHRYLSCNLCNIWSSSILSLRGCCNYHVVFNPYESLSQLYEKVSHKWDVKLGCRLWIFFKVMLLLVSVTCIKMSICLIKLDYEMSYEISVKYLNCMALYNSIDLNLFYTVKIIVFILLIITLPIILFLLFWLICNSNHTLCIIIEITEIKKTFANLDNIWWTLKGIKNLEKIQIYKAADL